MQIVCYLRLQQTEVAVLTTVEQPSELSQTLVVQFMQSVAVPVVTSSKRAQSLQVRDDCRVIVQSEVPPQTGNLTLTKQKFHNSL